MNSRSPLDYRWRKAGPLWLPCVMPNPGFIAGHLKPAAGGGGGSSVSDTFDGTGALSGNWTVIKQCARVSDAAKSDWDFSNDTRGAFYSGTSVGSVDQYVKVTVTAGTTGAGINPGVLFRATDGSTECYLVTLDVDSDALSWFHCATPSSTRTLIAQAGLDVTVGTSYGILVTGTGTSTAVRAWKTVAADAPTSATSWDGGAADAEILDDPGDPVDTGNYVGIAGYGSQGPLEWDSFFGGPVPP